MPRLKLTLAYVGTAYRGWQIQAWKDRPHPPTIQAEVQKAVSTVVGSKTIVQGAGRTDSGVHALGQVAHCDVPEERARIDWQRALHTHLPPDIRLVSWEIVRDNFDACADAVRKAYTYRLWLDDRFTPPHVYPFVWSCGPLNLDRLDAAIPHLVGTHDFKSMQNTGTPLKSTVRTLFSITRSPAPASPGPAAPLPPVDPVDPVDPENILSRELSLRFEANGFLKQMVRNLTGLLVACGRGKFHPEDIPALLEARDRTRSMPTAPAKGLMLSRVWY